MAGCYAVQSTISSSLNPCSSSNFRFPPKSSPPSVASLRISDSGHSLNLNFSFSVPRRNHHSFRRLRFTPRSALQEATDVNVETERSRRPSGRRTLFVNNLPWSLSDGDIKELFSQCGSVTNIEFFKQKNGKNRSFVHVTMGSREEAQAVIDKFDRQEVSGRVVRIEFSNSSKKPSLPPLPEEDFTPEKTGHSVYVSNLAWKVRTNDLKEFISDGGFNPVSIRIMFDSPGKKANGYGFVSFATREEADNAISTLYGKELMGRPLQLKLSDKNAD